MTEQELEDYITEQLEKEGDAHMPNFYNPYSVLYPNNIYSGTAAQPMYSTTPAPAYQQSATPAMQLKAMEWVEGEVGAKAFQMPAGLPANLPVPLWDSTDTVIYLKSWGPMGIPNPLQKLTYKMPDQNQQLLNAGGISGDQSPKYATQEDINALREEIKKLAEVDHHGKSAV